MLAREWRPDRPAPGFLWVLRPSLTVHPPHQAVDRLGRQADLSQDVLLARPGEVHAVGLEDQLERERGGERLLLAQDPTTFLDEEPFGMLQGLEVVLAPAVIPRMPEPGTNECAGGGGLALGERAGGDDDEMFPLWGVEDLWRAG